MIDFDKLTIGKISAEELLETYGSPLYVYDREIIVKRATDLRNCFPWDKKKFHFACKANSNISIISTINKVGYGIDAVSDNEIALALHAGVNQDDILFTGSNADKNEFSYAVDNKVLVNCGSLIELETYGKLFPGTDVCIRINPDFGAGHHQKVITGGPKSKFGIYFNLINEIKSILGKYNLNLKGVHEHIGSGFFGSEPFLIGMQALLDVAKQFPDLDFVNFGGGFGIPYKPDQSHIDLSSFGQKAIELFTKFCNDYGKELNFSIEPGRFIVAESGILLTRITTLKETPSFKFAGVDTGFNHLIRPMAYGSFHRIVNFSRNDNEQQDIVIAGNLCESGDVFTVDSNGISTQSITNPNVGDILGILNAGAYGFSMASNYNSRFRPAEVFVENGKHWIIRKRETIDDILKNMII